MQAFKNAIYTYRAELRCYTGITSLTPRYPFISGHSNKRFAAFLSQQQMMQAHGQHMISASTAKINPNVGPIILHRQGLSVLPTSMQRGKKNMLVALCASSVNSRRCGGTAKSGAVHWRYFRRSCWTSSSLSSVYAGPTSRYAPRDRND